MLNFILSFKQTIIKYKKQLLTFALIPVFLFRSSLSGFALYEPLPFAVEIHNYPEDSYINYGSSAVQIDTNLSSQPCLVFDIVFPHAQYDNDLITYGLSFVVHSTELSPVRFVTKWYDVNNVLVLTNYRDVSSFPETSGSTSVNISSSSTNNPPIDIRDVVRCHVSITWSSGSTRSETALLSAFRRTSSGYDYANIVNAINNQTTQQNNNFNNFMGSGSQFGGTTSGLLSGNDDLSGFIDDYTEIEQSMYDKFTENQSAVIGNFSGFSWGSLSTAVDWTSDYLNRIYDNSGDFRTMFMYPILAGIALIFIGRQGLTAYVRSRRDK